MRIAITLAAGLMALAAATNVLGHAAPERFDPAPGAVLDAAPARADGWFIQDVRRQGDASFIKVFDADGSRVDDGSPVIDDADRRHAYVNLNPGLGAGRYMVAWQTLSDEDDELDGGCFWFFVGQAAADAAHQAKLRIDSAEDCPTAAVAAPPEATASIKLDVPQESASGEVTVGLSTEGTTIRQPSGSGRDLKFGHYHLYLDTAPQLIHEEGATPTADMGQPTSPEGVMVWEDSYTLKDLKPGNHVVTAVLFYDDHTPFSPLVGAGASFTITGKDSGGDDGGVSTGAVIGIAIAAALGGLVVGGGLLARLRRR